MPRLLLVEDNPHVARIYSDKFSREGFEVMVANDGEQGLATAQTENPDIILLDLMLPKMNGFDVLKHLQADARTSALPVFVLSNRAWPDDVQQALALGARQFYSKGSTSMQDIVRQIRSECGYKKVLVLACNVAGTAPVVQVLNHPRLLCATVMVLAEAGSAVERGKPDAVVLDARPPVTNATLLLQQLKGSRVTALIPIVAISDQPQTLIRADACIPSSQINSKLRSIVLQKIGLDEEAAILAPAS